MPENHYIGAIGAVIVLLVGVIIGLTVYYNVTGTNEFTQVSETFTMTNATYKVTTNVSTSLMYCPASTLEFTCKYYNNETSTWNVSAMGTGIGKYLQYGQTFRFNGTRIPAPKHQNITMVNCTYYTSTGVMVRDNVNPSANTVFTLFPLAALVMIAGVILAVVMGFGRRRDF